MALGRIVGHSLRWIVGDVGEESRLLQTGGRGSNPLTSTRISPMCRVAQGTNNLRVKKKAKSAWIPTTRSNSGETTHLSVFEKESLGNNLGRSCRPRKLATPVTTSAFVGTNQKDEPITSGLPVAREQSPVMSTNRTCGLCVYMRAAERFRSPYTSMRACSKEGLPVTCGMDYSYLKATIGSTRMARRAGM